MTRLEAMEIVGNPRDIHIVIGEKDGKFGFAIMRGPGHRYKMLLSTDGFPLKNKQAAIEYIVALLKAAWDDTSKQLTDPDSLSGRIINSEQRPLSEMFLLHSGCLDKITENLTNTGKVNTWELFAEDDPALHPAAEAA